MTHSVFHCAWLCPPIAVDRRSSLLETLNPYPYTLNLMRFSQPQAISLPTELMSTQHCTFIAHWNCALAQVAPGDCTLYCTCFAHFIAHCIAPGLPGCRFFAYFLHIFCTLYCTWPPRLHIFLHIFCTFKRMCKKMRKPMCKTCAISGAVWVARCNTMCKTCAIQCATNVQPGRPGAIQCAIKCAKHVQYNVQIPCAIWTGVQFQCAKHVQQMCK